MKKWGFFIIIAILLSAFTKLPNLLEKDQIKEYSIVENGNVDLFPSEKQKNFKLTTKHIYNGDLLLVNNMFPIQENSIKSDIVNLSEHPKLTKEYALLNNDIKLSKEIGRKFSDMMAAAKKDGVNHFMISSGFRDFAEQASLYETLGSDYALPAGYSEHNLGLSLDIGSTKKTMYEAEEGKWIENNAWKYGFILRYPKDKSAITGIEYEPWHIRYVGLPHSIIMHEKKFVLEEYLDYLKKKKTITITIDQKVYALSYYHVTQNLTIQVPVNGQFEISGNNIDGVIVTSYLYK